MNPLGDWKLEPLHGALIISALLHGLVISTMGFVKPEQKRSEDKIPALEVVLVNARTLAQPDKAEAVAQANLDGGGNTDEVRRMKSPLPPPDKKPLEPEMKLASRTQQSRAQATKIQAEAPRKTEQVSVQDRQVLPVMTQADADLAVPTEPSEQAVAPEPEEGREETSPTHINTADLVARSLDAVRLQAMISKNMEIYQKRPKRKMFGSKVREYRFAAYIEAWRQKVEKVGNLNYPQAAKENKLYGQLQMTVGIFADGTVERIELNRSSGHPVLDEAAKRIVRLAAPYAEFPADIRKDTDVIEIVRTWTFTREDTLASGD